MRRRGLFVTFEGPEGSGKSTQASLLAERLAGEGWEVVRAREPGGTPTGEAIRGILQHDHSGEPIHPEAEVLLFAASRAQLVRQVILPALERGAAVVCDRFADSTTAYQGFGRGFGVEKMIEINAFAIDGAEPDVTFLLDLDVAAGFTRLEGRHEATGSGPDRFEQEERAFHDRVRCGYLELAKRFPDRFRVLDAAEAPDAIAAHIWEAVQRVLA